MVGRESKLRVVVTGFAVSYPFGGPFWDYVQYPLGLLEMGHEVLYLEDTGRWCYDNDAATFQANGANNAKTFAENLDRLDSRLSSRWHFRDADGNAYGRSTDEVTRFCAQADLFLNVSWACHIRPEYRRAQRVVLIDSDPLYTQASWLEDTIKARRDRDACLATHDLFFTFGEKVGSSDCRVPDCGLDWLPTRQPIVIRAFEPYRVPLEQRRQVMTTVGSWEPQAWQPSLDGVVYGGKSAELERHFQLPRHVDVPLELAIGGDLPKARFLAEGWHLQDPTAVSTDPWGYVSYLANSLAEWSVAKAAYVQSRSGWFSCRSACYLALGVPTAVQETGFSDILGATAGLVPFDGVESAAAAIRQIADDPVRHGEAALEVAQEFDHARVLESLLDRSMAAPANVHRGAS